jgi:hypothetical protein
MTTIPMGQKVPIGPVPIRWPLFPPAETVISDHASAACYRRSKHIWVHAVVVTKLGSYGYSYGTVTVTVHSITTQTVRSSLSKAIFDLSQ